MKPLGGILTVGNPAFIALQLLSQSKQHLLLMKDNPPPKSAGIRNIFFSPSSHSRQEKSLEKWKELKENKQLHTLNPAELWVSTYAGVGGISSKSILD